MAGLLQQMELNAKAFRIEKKRKRRWNLERELKTLPDPTQRFANRGYVVEAFVVKSRMIQPFARNIAYFRLGSLVRGNYRPCYSAFFNRQDVSVLLQQLQRLRRWLLLGAHHRALGKITAARWEASTLEIPTTNDCEREGGACHKGVGCFPTTFARRGNQASLTEYRLLNLTDHAVHEAFFREGDLCAVEEVLIRLSDANCNLLFETYDVEEADRQIIDVTPHRLKLK